MTYLINLIKKYMINFDIKIDSGKVLNYFKKDFLLVLICFFSINVPFVSYQLKSYEKYFCYVRIFLILYIFLLLMKNNLFINNAKKMKNFIIFNLFIATIVISTLINGGSFGDFIVLSTRPYLICIYIVYIKLENNSVDSKIVFLKKILITLLLIDVISIIFYPNGLYETASYSENWFLGYKSSRLIFFLPMITFCSYCDYRKNKKTSCMSKIIWFLTLSILFYCKGTTSLISISLFCLLILLLEIDSRNKIICRLKIFFESYLFLAVIILLINIFLIFFSDSNFISFILENILHKDSTLSHRTYIWDQCLIVLKEHFFIGVGYLNNSQYINLVNYPLATSPHNYLLTIMMSSGLIGILLHFWMLYYSFTLKSNSKESNVLKISIICFLIIGLSSSSLVFSVFSYLPFILLESL